MKSNKRYFYIFICFSFCFFTGCSKKNSIISIDNESSLKLAVETKNNEAFWIDELEGDILTKNISSNQYLSNGIEPDFDVLSCLHNSKTEIYPYLDNNFSTDISSFDPKLLAFVKKICTSLKNNSSLESYFDSEYIFNYVFFKQDLADNWNHSFGVKFPTKNHFDKYIICSENDSFDFTQIPVRMYNKFGFIDIILTITTNEKKLNVKDIKIIKWEKYHE